MKYLGLPLGAHFKASNIWNGIIEKMEKRLAGGRNFIYQREDALH